MSDPSWPTDIPSEPEQSDYRETIVPNLSSFKPDVGPPTSWRRSTLDSTNIQASFLLTYTERDSFKTFFRDTLRDGTLPFQWTNPAYNSGGRYIFDPENPPQLQSIGATLWRLGVSLIKLTGGTTVSDILGALLADDGVTVLTADDGVTPLTAD